MAQPSRIRLGIFGRLLWPNVMTLMLCLGILTWLLMGQRFGAPGENAAAEAQAHPRSFGVVIALLLVGAAACAWAARRSFQMVRSIADAMARMGDGNWSAPAAVTGRGDWGQWASKLNLRLDELTRAERAQREKERRLELVLEGVRLGLWDWNIPTGQVDFNAGWAAMFGFEGDEVEPHLRGWEKLVYPADLASRNEAIQAHLSGRTAHYECEYRMRTKAGQWKWIVDQGRVVERDEAGKPLRFTGMHTDVTDRQRTRQVLRENEAHLAEAQRVAHLGSWDWNLLTGEMTWSDECYRILEIDPAETRPTFDSFMRFVHPADRERIHEAATNIPPNVTSSINEFRVVCPDGRIRYVVSKSRSYANAFGQPTRKLGTIQDITDCKITEDRLRESNAMMLEALERERGTAMELEAAMEQLAAATQEAEAAVRSKSEFLANMSHEIRTPMTAILGYAEVIAGAYDDPRTLDPAQVLEHLRTIQRNGNYLLEIINGILDISKIEAGKMEVECLRCSPIELLADVRSLMRVRADERGLPIHVETVGAIPDTIETDPARVKQILINLVGNAIKFTETGSVTIEARFIDGRRSGRGGHGIPLMQFDVIDTGMGMTPEQVARLFRPFAQADSSMSRRFGGTGLGLIISKRFAHILGGDISAESTPGKGSTFRVTIAAGTPAGVKRVEMTADSEATERDAGANVRDAARLAADAAQMPGCRVLLVEDGPDNQRLITFVLRKAGADVTVAENGQVAVDIVRKVMNADAEVQERSLFDIVLMDMQMPVMDGYEATGRLREMGFKGPIIAVTAHAMAHDREKCMGAGCDDFAPKPIDRRTLLATIRKHLTRFSTTEAQV